MPPASGTHAAEKGEGVDALRGYCVGTCLTPTCIELCVSRYYNAKC